MPRVTERQVEAALCRKDFSEFVRRAWHVLVPEPLRWNWHMTVACDLLQEAYERVFANKPREWDLCTNQPPGTTKSILHSIMAHAWGWTRVPHLRFLGASYSSPCAEKLSMYCRDVVKSAWYRGCFPEVELRSDQDNKTHFMTRQGGERFATSVGGSATGLVHAHVITIDDPVNPEEALSEAQLYAANHWMTHTLLSRKVNVEVTFTDLVMQRLGQGDPTDEFLSVSPRVRHVVIPADTDYEVKPPELVKFYVGGLMDPERKPAAALEEEKKKGDAFYSGQYGQSPKPIGGGTFKTDQLRYGRPPESFKCVARFWDKSATTAQEARRGAYTAGVKMGVDAQDRVWVLNVVRGRWDTAAREELIRQTALQDGTHVVVGQEQEPGGGGKESALATVKRLMGFRVRTLVARGKKEVRAESFSVQVNAGNVWLPEQFRQGVSWVGWAREYVDEMSHWPFSKYKDQIDASAGAHTVVARGRLRSGPLRGSNSPTAAEDSQRASGFYTGLRGRLASRGRVARSRGLGQ